jgi:hypothetical protein
MGTLRTLDLEEMSPVIVNVPDFEADRVVDKRSCGCGVEHPFQLVPIL